MTEPKAYAFKLLARKDFFTKELEKRLKQKGFTDEDISDTIDYLQQLGYLNDEKLAKDLSLYWATNRNYSNFAIAHRLKKRGAPLIAIESALQLCSKQDAECLRIKRLLDSWKNSIRANNDLFYVVSKYKAKLARLGFSFDSIADANVDSFIQKLFEEQNSEE